MTFADTLVLGANGPIRIEEATVVFRDSTPSVPSFDLRASGELFGTTFTAEAFGTLAHPIRVFRGFPPLTDALVRSYLTGAMPAAAISAENNAIPLSAPAVLTGGAPVYHWDRIVVDEQPLPDAQVPEAPDSLPTAPEESATEQAGTNLLP